MSTFLTKRRHSLFLAAAAIALSGAAVADHSWGGYHWARTATPFTLQLGSNLTTTQWQGILSQVSIDWNSPETFGAASTPVLTAVVTGKSRKNCSMVAGTTQVCNGKYGANGWLGLATINITDGVHITRGSAKMNDTYFNGAYYNNPNEKRHVMCQEVAHTFGLGHQSEDGSSQNSCMDYFSNTGANAGSTVSTRPNQHDFDQLNLIYGGHDDTSSTVSSQAAAAAAPGAAPFAGDIGDDPESWGRLVRQSASGRSSVYERSNQDGSLTLTHVYWTVEAAADCPSCDHRYRKHD